MKKTQSAPRPLARIAALARSGSELAQSLSGRKSRRRRHELQLVANSTLFDPEWYLQTYPDLFQAKVDPLRHYIDLGWREGRDPGPGFATSAYLKANPDVAAAGVNPLLHFLEFGYFEGRAPSAHRIEPARLAVAPATFGPAAPSASFPLLRKRPVVWLRGYRLDRDRKDLFAAGDYAVGYAANPAARTRLRTAFAMLKNLSGFGRASSGSKLPEMLYSTEQLLDAWFVNSAQLRTRWDCEGFPVVIRAYQCDPSRSGAIALVGEGLVESRLAAFDLHLRNRFFPILLVFAESEGRVSGTRMLAFPSLCRGGVHYPELLCSVAMCDALANPMLLGEMLALRLVRLTYGGGSPAICRISVEIAEGDGRGPLFEPDARLWLQRVIQVGIDPVAEANGSTAQRFLAMSVALAPSTPRNPTGGSLAVGHNMIPTIGGLTEQYPGSQDGSDELAVPLIIAGSEPSLPAFRIQFPRELLPSLRDRTGRHSAWPRLKRGLIGPMGGAVEAAAIAQPNCKSLSNAELLAPRSRDLARECNSRRRKAITWMVDANGWPKGLLVQAVYALSLQIGGDEDCVTFLGTADIDSMSVARERFAGRVRTALNVATALTGAQTPLTGYLSAGIILHDNGTAAELASLLSDDAMATASCVIVDARRSAAGGPVLIVHGGILGTPTASSLGPTEYRDGLAHLWGTAYSVAAPTREIWLARSSCLNEWLAAPGAELGNRFHICSSFVTASQMARQAGTKLPAFIPIAPESRVTRMQAFFG